MTYDPRQHGAKCDACPFNGRLVCPPETNTSASMILLGESPGNVELYEGRPFCGPTGKKVNEALAAAGIHRKNDLHVTNTLLCMPKKSDTDATISEAVACCKPRLERELSECSATIVFSCGKPSLQAMLGESHQDHFVGALTPNALAGKNILHCWHPTFVFFHAPQLQPLFHTFLRRAWGYASGTLTPWQWPNFHIDLNDKALEILQSILNDPDPVGFDVETIPDMDILTAVGIGNSKHTVSIPWDSYDTQKWGTVLGIDAHGDLGSKAKTLIANILESHLVITQNGAYDVHEMSKKGLNFKNGFDIMLAHAVRWPQLKHGLESVALQYYHCPRWKTEFKSYSDEKGSSKWRKAEPSVLRTYNARDTYMQRILYEPVQDALSEIPNGQELYRDRMFQAEVAAASSNVGLLVSREKITEHRDNITKLMQIPMTAVIDQAKSLGMEGFNPASYKSLNFFFFKCLKVKPVKYSEKTGKPSLDDKTLSNILASSAESEPAKVAARRMIKVRMYSKLLSTYVDGLEAKLESVDNAYGILHPDYKVHAAQTGRWGSFVHTIPGRAKIEDGQVVAPGIRDVFVAREGYHIVEADFSQQELRGIALLSGDKPWLEAYKRGDDIHQLTAVDLFGSMDGRSKDEKKQLRSLGKAFNLATNYCTSDLEKAARGVWEVLRVDFPQLELWAVLKMLKTKYKKHPAMAEWRAQQWAFAREHDYIEEPFSKRRRYFYGQVKETEAYNFPVQAGGAYLMMVAIRNVMKWIDWKDHVLVIPNWHDAIYVESKRPLEAVELLKSSMEQTLEYRGNSMKFSVDVAIGKNLGKKVDVETWKKENVA